MIWSPALIEIAMCVTLLGLMVIVGYALWADRRAARVAVRRKALSEARNSVQSLSDIAKAAADETVSAPRTGISRGRLRQQLSRAYHYGRAAEVIASIPADRL